MTLGLGRNVFCFYKFFPVSVFGRSRMQQGEIMPKWVYAQREQRLSEPHEGFLITLHTHPLRGCPGCSRWAQLAGGGRRGSPHQKCLLIFRRDAAAVSCSSPASAEGRSGVLGPLRHPCSLLAAATTLAWPHVAKVVLLGWKTCVVQAVAQLSIGVHT